MSTITIVFILCSACDRLIIVDETRLKQNWQGETFYACSTVLSQDKKVPYFMNRIVPRLCDEYIDCEKMVTTLPIGVVLQF